MNGVRHTRSVGGRRAGVGRFAPYLVPIVMAAALGWVFFFQSENGFAPPDVDDGEVDGPAERRMPEPPSAPDSEVRHVVILSLDTTRADHMGFYGNPWVKTPSLDALAAESVVLEDCMVAVPSTLASHTTLMTGKYPHTHGVSQNGYMVNPQNVMLAEILTQAGFRTLGFIASFPLSRRFNFAQGFDEFNERFDLFTTTEFTNQQNQRRAKVVTDEVIAELDRSGIPDRLFLFVHYFDPHAPYDPYVQFLRQYDETRTPPFHDLEPIRAELAKNPGAPTPEALIAAKHYAAEITFMDKHIGRLLDYLRGKGVLDSALLLVTSDHGETLWEGSSTPFDHGWVVYQSNIRAVAMFRLPNGKHGGARIRQVTGTIDLMPTILRRLGLPTPADVEGAALDLDRPEASFPERVRFAEASKPRVKGEDEGDRWHNADKPRCVRAGRYKFIRNPAARTEELYDLSSDAEEAHNLLASPTEDIARVAGSLRAKLGAWDASAAPLRSEFESGDRSDTMKRLQSLGYMSDDAGGGAPESQPSPRSP